MKILKALYDQSELFDIRDINQVLQGSLDFLKYYFSCRSCVWVSQSYLNSAKNKREEFKGGLRILSSNQRGFDDQSIIPGFLSFGTERKELEEEFFVQMLQAFQEQKAQKINRNKEEWILLPQYSKDLSEFLGGFAFQVEEKKTEDTELEVLRHQLSTYLTYSLQVLSENSLSYKDTLTPLFNQKYLSMALDREVHRSTRYQRSFSILFFDIDDFKFVNDEYGHMTGSFIISELGHLIFEAIRDSDYGFRFGGDEFVLILVETENDEAGRVAERMRKKVEDHIFRKEGKEHKITVSVGVATFPDHGKTKEEILHLADQAMYDGKKSHKNIVYMAS